MSRFDEIGTLRTKGAKYTQPLSNETVFPLNTPIDNKLYKTFAIGDYVPKQTFFQLAQGTPFNLPDQVFYNKNKYDKFFPVLYRVKGAGPSQEYTNGVQYWWGLWSMDAYSGMDTRYSLPSSIYPSGEIPYQTNGAYNFGYEQPMKGNQLQWINPIVNYNPNKVIIEPYLCETAQGGINRGTYAYKELGTEYAYETFDSDYHILHLDDIINDAILSNVPGGIENRHYELRFRLLYYNYGFFGNTYRSEIADQSEGVPYLVPRPLFFEKPFIIKQDASMSAPELVQFKDTFDPFCYSRNILIGSTLYDGVGKLGLWSDWACSMYTSYAQFENFRFYQSASSDITKGIVENMHPYVSFSSLSGANKEIYEQMKLTVASLGFAFVTSMAAANAIMKKDGITDELLEQYPTSIYYPTIDKSTGKVTTKIVSGEEAKTTPLKRMGDEGKNPYDELPVVDPDDLDENEYIDEIPIKTELPVNPTDVFQSRYAMSNLDLEDFAQYLWTGDTSIISKTLDGLKMNGENPMNFILSLKMFPFDLTKYGDHSPVKLQFGNAVDTGIIVERLSNVNIVLELGEIDFRKYFKNFLDYEPYTTAKLYIPYCGEITVETALFVGHKIKITMIVDIITGSCCACVYRDGIPCLYVDGNMSVDIQVTGQNMTEYVNATKNMIGREAGNIGGIASFGFSGGSRSSESLHPTSTEQSKAQNSANEAKQITQGAGGIIGAVADGLITAYEWNNTPTPLAVCGSSSDLINWYKPQYAYFVIEQPVTMPASDYGNQYGYACFDFGKLPNEGLVVCNNAHVQPPNATEPETTEINKLLNTGVWI